MAQFYIVSVPGREGSVPCAGLNVRLSLSAVSEIHVILHRKICDYST